MKEFRPLRRFKQAASEEECLSLLQSAPRGILSVTGENGYPYGVPMNFVYREGKIYFHCAREGHKLDAIGANDKVSFTVLSEPVRNEGEWWYCLTSVIIFGRIAVLSDPARVDVGLRAMAAKYFPDDYDLETDLKRNASHAFILELTIDHMTGKHVREK